MNSVLITGGAGYIGSHTAKLLARKGFTPVVVDNLSRGHEWAVKWGPLEKGDLADGKFLESVFRKYSPVAVLHFAAYAYIGESVIDPGKYYRNNVVATLSLVDAMIKAKVSRLIFSSTCATYGIPAHLPIDESMDQRPINPYGWSKLMIEQILRDYDQAHGLKSVVLRYFNAAGADPDAEIGEDHQPETHLIPLVLQAAAGKLEQVQIFGADHPTRDGTCIRDYIHVTDLAQAHHLALEVLLAGGPSDHFNLGNGKGFTVEEVIETARKITGRRISVKHVDKRAGDPPELVCSAEKAHSQLGWRPEFTSLETILESAWQWHTKVGWLRPEVR